MTRTSNTLQRIARMTAPAVLLLGACARPGPQPVVAPQPPQPSPHAESMRLGDSRLQEGRVVEALSFYREGLSQNPKSVELGERAAGILDKLGRTNEAMDTYGDALRHNPDSERLHMALAHLLYKTENYSSAVVHFKQVERVNPLNQSAYRWAAMCFIKLDRWEDAQKEIEAEARIRPGDPDTQRTLESIRESVANKRAAERLRARGAASSGSADDRPAAVSLGVVTPRGFGAAPPPRDPESQPSVSVYDIPEPPKPPGVSID